MNTLQYTPNQKNMQTLQKFNWGEIEWLLAPTFLESHSVGILRIYPHQELKKHLHFTDNKTHYVFHGEGIQWIDGEKHAMLPKTSYYIPSGQTHRIKNPNGTLLETLVVFTSAYHAFSNSIYLELDSFNDKKFISFQALKDDPNIVSMHDFAMNRLSIPINIFDHRGESIACTNEYPEFCRSCNIEENLSNCSIYAPEKMQASQYNFTHAESCEKGVFVVNVPLIYRNISIGFIKAGHIKSCESVEQLEPSSNKLNSICLSLNSFTTELLNYYLLKSRTIINKDNQKLNMALCKKKYELRQSQWRNTEQLLLSTFTSHFLFNILNTLGSLAVKEGADLTYNAIIDLSKLLRSNHSRGNQFSTVLEEMNYIQSYINLVKYDISTPIHVQSYVDRLIEDASIPTNIIQPLVENTFVHAFKKIKDASLLIAVERDGDSHVKITVSDNGAGIPMDKLTRIQDDLSSTEINYDLDTTDGNGLKIIKSRLNFYFNGDFSIEITSKIHVGTNVTITLPIN